MVSRPVSAAALPLNRPPWVAATVFAALATALITWPTWPGYMSYDSLLAWDQARYGVRTALWPPLHTYLFQLGDMAGSGPGVLFAVQTFVLILGATLTLRMLTPGRSLGWLLAVFFLGGLAAFPTLLGSMLAHWRDVPTGAFALLGLAFWLAAAQSRTAWLLAPAILAFGVALGLRYNALVLVAPMIALMIWRPFLGGPTGPAPRIIVVAATVLSLGLGWASTQWRLPDLVRLPNPGGLGGAQLFDVIGVSACSGMNYVPSIVTGGQPVTVRQLRQAYDPRHLHATLTPRPGAPRLIETDGGGVVQQVWRDLLLREPVCYLEHRSAVFVEQMGMARGGVFYPAHGGIDANPFGLALERPDAARAVSAYVAATADDPWRRPWILYPAALVLALAAAMRERRAFWLLGALMAGAFAYPALLFVAAPAADARYIFPSNALCLLTGLAALGLMATRRRALR
ncbi:MAG: hypothetical protein U1C74_06500 [Phenylobacterium sp.]|nr:hypothetical protein [Phenylobacterium sp.]